MMEWLQPIGSLVILGGFCIGLYRIVNGKMAKKVDRETCHAHIDGLKQWIHSLDTDIQEVKKDVKELLRLNGK